MESISINSQTIHTDVYLYIPVEPWSFSVKLQSHQLSQTKLSCYLSLANKKDMEQFEGISELLQVNQYFKIQINSPFEHLDSPVVYAVLSHKEIIGHNLELKFHFSEIYESILQLIAESSLE